MANYSYVGKHTCDTYKQRVYERQIKHTQWELVMCNQNLTMLV